MTQVMLLCFLISLGATALSPPLHAQVVVTSATGAGYGGSGAFDTNAAWRTSADGATGKAGTAIRVFPAPYLDTSSSQKLADPALRYRYLPFALYLFPDHMKPHRGAPVHYNMHYDPASRQIAYSTLTAFDLEEPGIELAFAALYHSGEREYPENLFLKRMREMHIEGKDFKLDWTATSEPRLVKEFFFTAHNSLSGSWQEWFGDDWAAANLALVQDYCAAATYAAMLWPSFRPNANGGGGTWRDSSGELLAYDLPSSSYQVPSATATYHELYNEMVAVFSGDRGELTWALIFEPVADYYPAGKPELRSWSSASDIAQVLAEKAFESEVLYRQVHQDFAQGEALEPVQGSYTRYFAHLFYLLKDTAVFQDFLFRETRAIFTNNYQGGYLADQYLLADALLPEVNNSEGYLGGWAIVYLRDLVRLPPRLDALRYGVFMEQRDLGGELALYGELASFSSLPPPTTMSWVAKPAGEEQTAELAPVATDNVSSVSALLGVMSLQSYEGLYVAQQNINLNDVYLSSLYGEYDFSPQPELLDSSLLQPLTQPVGEGVIGSARYGVPLSGIHSYLQEAAKQLVSKLRQASTLSAGSLGRTQEEISSSITLETLGVIAPGQSGSAYAAAFLTAPASVQLSLLQDATGEYIDAPDGTPLLSLKGNLPVTFAISLPQTQVQAQIIILDPEEGWQQQEAIPFRISDLFTYDISVESIALGWYDQEKDVDLSALQSHLALLPPTPTLDDWEALRQEVGAAKCLLLAAGEKLYGAATLRGSEYTGLTVVLIPGSSSRDLILSALILEPSSHITEAKAKIGVENTASSSLATQLLFQVDNPWQSYRIPVQLEPGFNDFDLPFTLPPEGGNVRVEAVINPDRDLLEDDYSNNSAVATIYLPPPAPPLLVDSDDCLAGVAWIERRYHFWEDQIPWYNTFYSQYYYCFHEYGYYLEFTATVESEYQGEMEEVPLMKAGYGFTPQVSVTAKVNLDYHVFSESFHRNRGNIPSQEHQAVITLPHHAYLSWDASGQLLHDYVVFNPEKATRQEATNIPLELVSATQDKAVFSVAPNPVSENNAKRIYTNVLLRDGEHSFTVRLNGGALRYRIDTLAGPRSSQLPDYMNPEVWNQSYSCLISTAYGRVEIAGTMYEDDFTGAVMPIRP